MTPKKLRWLIAHQPAYLFVRTAEAFAKELDKTCPGQFEIEILTMKQYIQKYGDIPGMELKPAAVRGIEEGVASADAGVFKPAEWSEVKTKWKAVFDGMRQEKFHLSQTQVTVIGGHLSDQFAVLDLPFLFDSHDHVSTVLDGEIGDRLCEDMGKKTKIKGLGFTYSGGYRVVGSNHVINDLNALHEVNITTTPMTKNFFGKFAATATSRLSQKIEEIAQSASNGGAVETTYLRFSGKNILKTNHSMFLTTILVGGEFFETLTSEQQDAFRKAAKVVAKLERQWSLDDAAKYEQDAVAKGVDIREITEAERDKMREAAPDQYQSAYWAISGSESLVNEIKKTK